VFIYADSLSRYVGFSTKGSIVWTVVPHMQDPPLKVEGEEEK
jgi:hypothetical protein